MRSVNLVVKRLEDLQNRYSVQWEIVRCGRYWRLWVHATGLSPLIYPDIHCFCNTLDQVLAIIDALELGVQIGLGKEVK